MITIRFAGRRGSGGGCSPPSLNTLLFSARDEHASSSGTAVRTWPYRSSSRLKTRRWKRYTPPAALDDCSAGEQVEERGGRDRDPVRRSTARRGRPRGRRTRAGPSCRSARAPLPVVNAGELDRRSGPCPACGSRARRRRACRSGRGMIEIDRLRSSAVELVALGGDRLEHDLEAALEVEAEDRLLVERRAGNAIRPRRSGRPRSRHQEQVLAPVAHVRDEVSRRRSPGVVDPAGLATSGTRARPAVLVASPLRAEIAPIVLRATASSSRSDLEPDGLVRRPGRRCRRCRPRSRPRRPAPGCEHRVLASAWLRCCGRMISSQKRNRRGGSEAAGCSTVSPGAGPRASRSSASARKVASSPRSIACACAGGRGRAGSADYAG